MTFKDKTVLITGGSAGIGAAFARDLAKQGAKLILVARDESKLKKLQAELGTEVQIIALDLSTPGAAATVRQATKDIDLLINNAGFGSYGNFVDLDIATQSEAIALNVTALVEMSHAFLPELEKRQGGIINVASTAGFQPVPHMAVYGATKAFVLSFSEALWAEYRDRGVAVLALCPGATATAFFERAGSESAALGAKASVDDVVRDGLRAYAARRSYVISGLGNYWRAQGARFMPRATLARMVFSMMKPR